jgi:hypothetical protein
MRGMGFPVFVVPKVQGIAERIHRAAILRQILLGILHASDGQLIREEVDHGLRKHASALLGPACDVGLRQPEVVREFASTCIPGITIDYFEAASIAIVLRSAGWTAELWTHSRREVGTTAGGPSAELWTGAATSEGDRAKGPDCKVGNARRSHQRISTCVWTRIIMSLETPAAVYCTDPVRAAFVRQEYCSTSRAAILEWVPQHIPIIFSRTSFSPCNRGLGPLSVGGGERGGASRRCRRRTACECSRATPTRRK